MDLKGKAAIVTGGGTGVGRATCLQLAAAGCSVLVDYSRSKDAAEETARLAREQGVQAIAFQADVADDDACRAMVAEAERAFGRLDVLVNNAGTTRFIAHQDLDSVERDDWIDILSVNLIGPFQCTRAALPLLRADGGGEVVMTSSVAGLIGTGSSIPYCASKAALNNLTVTLARVCGPEVRVNAVAPGFIDGEWLQEGLGKAYDAVKGAMEARSPLGRVTTPETVAQAILSLIAGSDLVTGHVLPVEGGMIIGRG
jgi:3-oxoacyl-[acyl-carrier protein] reductase